MKLGFPRGASPQNNVLITEQERRVSAAWQPWGGLTSLDKGNSVQDACRSGCMPSRQAADPHFKPASCSPRKLKTAERAGWAFQPGLGAAAPKSRGWHFGTSGQIFWKSPGSSGRRLCSACGPSPLLQEVSSNETDASVARSAPQH